MRCRAGHGRVRTDKSRTHWRSLALGEADRNRIEASGEFSNRPAGSHSDVEQPLAMHLSGRTFVVRQFCCVKGVALRQGLASPGVLWAQQLRARMVRIIGFDGGLDVE